jgi:hypothetical protein
MVVDIDAPLGFQRRRCRGDARRPKPERGDAAGKKGPTGRVCRGGCGLAAAAGADEAVPRGLLATVLWLRVCGAHCSLGCFVGSSPDLSLALFGHSASRGNGTRGGFKGFLVFLQNPLDYLLFAFMWGICRC